jgi:hypothetical protein
MRKTGLASVSLEDGRGHKPRNVANQPDKARNRFSSRASRIECSLAVTLF